MFAALSLEKSIAVRTSKMRNVDLCLKQNWFILTSLTTTVSASYNNWSYTWSHSGFRELPPWFLLLRHKRVRQSSAVPRHSPNSSLIFLSTKHPVESDSLVPAYLLFSMPDEFQLSSSASWQLYLWLLCNRTTIQRVHSSAERGIFLFKLQSNPEEISNLNRYLKRISN